LSPRSGYGVGKVVEMLNSERIRDLSKEIQRASVLMALDAAGTPVDDLLRDETRRQQALDCYEEGQRKQLEEFEARKTKENAEIQAEMERLTAHYGERIQQNQDQVAREKEALRNWQMAKQHESQRIAEVIELCAKQPAASESALSATAGAQSGTARGSGGRSS
jgi:DNA anti-recombination protein RmuC